MKNKTCPACNEGHIVDLAEAGRWMPFRNIPDLEIPDDLVIPTCDVCGEEWFDARTSARVDDALKAAYQVAISTRAEGALRRLTGAGFSQQQLERLLGLSAGYISKVKSGKETSSQLVATLMLLAADPISRVQELVSLWRSSAPMPEVLAPLEKAGQAELLTHSGNPTWPVPTFQKKRLRPRSGTT